MTGPASVARSEFAGRYVVEREIGRGATATVYLARDRVQDRVVAIKVLRPDLSESVVSEIFLREIRLTAGLKHPRIVAALDAGDDDGRLYFVLPYMDGGTLRQRVERDKQLSIADALTIAANVADALDYAHSRGIIHRDVKPENILFANDEASLADFGVARALEKLLGEKSTSSGIVRGTPAYMSPEQASGGRDYDGRSDIFSLGCVLYEMLAGIPAFVGPTPEVVLAQRFAHSPRDLRVYRPSVPDAVEAVVRRSLAFSPADRFATAGEFAVAMRSALNAPVASTPTPHPVVPAPGPAPRTHPLVLVAGVSALIGLLVFGVHTVSQLRVGVTATQHPDTTRLVVFPLERDSSAGVRTYDDDLLHEALSRWRGIILVDQMQIADAIRRRGQIRSGPEAGALSASLGAGRYVRGRLTPVGNAWRAYAALYNNGDTRALYQATEHVPLDLAGAIAAYRRLADSLLLHGAGGDAKPEVVAGTRSLPAVQAMGRAQAGLDDWDLAAADAAFEAAVGFDPNYARANLWLAQVRAWREMPPTTWASVASRAYGASGELSDREHTLAHALVLLGRGDYAAACGVYDELRRENDHDFAAWFGLGQCRGMDKLVVPDANSPSGWRFRSSYQRAALAYSRAFELLPSVHREYERGAFEPLMRLLMVSTDLMTGFAVGRDTSLFLARPALIGDTLVMVPYPWALVFSGSPSTFPPQFEKALERQRTEFRRIAASWSAAFPQSAGAKQLVAIALELLGDRDAIDTLRLARRLTASSVRRTQLAAREVLLLVKFGVPDKLSDLKSAQALADSVLRTTADVSFDAEALAPIAAVVGRCAAAERIVRRLPAPTGALQISEQLFADGQVVQAREALGCGTAGHGPTLRQLATAVAREPLTDSAGDRRLDEMFLVRPALLSPVLDSDVVSRLATTSSNELLRAAAALTRHDTSGTRAALDAFAAKSRPESATPDIAYPSARLWASAGDTARAIASLDRTLGDLRSYDPRVLTDLPTVAALVRSMALRAELAVAARDVDSARRWATPAALLWSSSDPELRPAVRRMQKYASLR